MRLLAVSCALALSGCAHEFDMTMRASAEPPPPPSDSIGHSHQPYAGKPKYLAAARPLQPTTGAQPGEDNPCRVRSTACDTRLRAMLAAIDAQLAVLASPPTETQLTALRLSLTELTPLLAAYPDVMSEHDELAELVEKLATQTPIDQATTRRRMIELADLLRVQLAAAQ